MNARQFYDLVVDLRKAQKQAATTLKYEEILKLVRDNIKLIKEAA